MDARQRQLIKYAAYAAVFSVVCLFLAGKAMADPIEWSKSNAKALQRVMLDINAECRTMNVANPDRALYGLDDYAIDCRLAPKKYGDCEDWAIAYRAEVEKLFPGSSHLAEVRIKGVTEFTHVVVFVETDNGTMVMDYWKPKWPQPLDRLMGTRYSEFVGYLEYSGPMEWAYVELE